LTRATTVAGATSERHLGIVARIFGIVFSPRRTYADVAARPRILGVLAFVTLVAGGLQVALLTSEKGQEAFLSAFQEQIRQAEAQGRTVSAEQRQNMERLASVMGYVSAAAGIVLGPAFLALLALIVCWLFNAVLGGEVSFRHVYSVIVHSTVVTTVGAMFTLPLIYAKGEIASPTQLSVFLPMLDEASFVTYVLKALDLLYLWWIISMAIGLAVLYKRRTGPIAMLIATVRSSFG
jgi:Yip1 domain